MWLNFFWIYIKQLTYRIVESENIYSKDNKYNKWDPYDQQNKQTVWERTVTRMTSIFIFIQRAFFLKVVKTPDSDKWLHS